MAIYLPIRKVCEDDRFAEYRFGDERQGLLRLDKRSGVVALVEPAPGDEKEFLSGRAARKLLLHWKKGEFPDETCWAS